MKKVAKIIFAAIAILSIFWIGKTVWTLNSRIDNFIVINHSIDDGNSFEGIFIL